MMLDSLFGNGADRRRRRALHRAPQGPLRHYLSHPFPDRRTSVDDLRLLAIDFETTGLDPLTDQILSVGFLPIDGPEIRFAGARHLVLRQPVAVGQSAAIHGVTDDDVAAGAEPSEVIAQVLDALTGRVLLAHHAVVEDSFLTAACQSAFGGQLVVSAVDTLELQTKVLRVNRDEAPRGTFRLGTCRERCGLPRYRAHEALTDALACAELYLAQVAELSRGRALSLRTLQT